MGGLRWIGIACACCACGSSPASEGSDAATGIPPDGCRPQSGVTRGGLASIDLSVPGAVFELDPSTGDYGRRVTDGNGCAVTVEPTGGFGGAPGIRLVSPDTLIGGPDGNAEYCGFAGGANLWSDATVDIAQLNVRYMLYVGPGYAPSNAGGGPKAFIPYVMNALDVQAEPMRSSRPMTFWGNNIGAPMSPEHAAVGVTDATVASYQEPESEGWPVGPGRDALYFGPSPDHTGATTSGTPVVGDEWVCIEHEMDLRQDRGNPNGINRLWVWTSDGVLAGAVMDIPLSWHAEHDFTGRYFGPLDGLGYYWNTAARRLPDDHLIYSHVAFSANRTPGDPIGPPPGFTSGCE
ncbi:MAG: hypothetical protein HOV81_22095 [Kofleriaceae bacterium]|nr:hypothetical protein [Kofleriaceae bacterium]